MAGLTVLIPTLNEASRLPLLLADLDHWPHPLQVLVVDGGSDDALRQCTPQLPRIHDHRAESLS